MVAVITGDVINSEKIDTKKWLSELKKYFDRVGKTPEDWAVYRGDEFQLRLNNAEHAFITAIELKARLKQYKGLDVRLSIGLGDEIGESKNILESNGTAFTRSGRTFEELKKHKSTLMINTGIREMDQELNLYIKLALNGFMDKWTVASAEIVSIALENQSASQEEIARMTGIAQAAISQRLKRANFELLMELNSMIVKKIKTLE